jgi:hypothetical protein
MIGDKKLELPFVSLVIPSEARNLDRAGIFASLKGMNAVCSTEIPRFARNDKLCLITSAAKVR